MNFSEVNNLSFVLYANEPDFTGPVGFARDEARKVKMFSFCKICIKRVGLNSYAALVSL